MIVASVIVFTVAAVYGLLLARMFFGAKQVRIPVALGHGVLAVTGDVLALLAIAQAGFTMLSGISAALFVIAAIGGVVLLTQHITKGAPSSQLIAIHALVAVAGYVLLLTYAFGG